jgi:predicted nucleotidyltransferase
MRVKTKLKKIAALPDETQQMVLAALLSTLFKEKNVQLTVVGGAAVQFHTNAAYVTKDIDAILQGDTIDIIEAVMSSLRFKRTTMYRHFEHPLFKFVVEFPPSPIEIASRVISKVALVNTEEGPVRVIRVEDIIMDRITAAVEWKDEASLEQAKLLWLKNKGEIDLPYLKKFAKEEGYADTLRQVMKGE